MSLKVTSREKTIGTFIVKPSGTLDTNTHQILDNRINMLLDVSPKMIVFDMEELEYISSMGVRSVARAKKELKKIKGEVVLLNLKPQIQKVFDIIKALPKEQIFNNIKELDEYLDLMQKKGDE